MTREMSVDLSRAGFGKGVFISLLLLCCSAAKLGSETYSVSVSYPALYGSFEAIKVRDYFTAGTDSDKIVVGHFTPSGTSSSVKARGVQLVTKTNGLFLYSSGGITFGDVPSGSGYYQFVELSESTENGYLPNMCKWVEYSMDVVPSGAVASGHACGSSSGKYAVIGIGPSGNTAVDSKIYLSSNTASGDITGPNQVSGSMLCCRVGYN